MNATKVEPLDLRRYTFFSLQFCGTPVETWRGDRFRTALNHWYMPLIRAGWPVPLSFIIDVCTLLFSGHAAPRGFGRDAELPPEFAALSPKYRQTLEALRRNEVFQAMADLVRSTRDERLQQRAVRTFLEFLVAGVSGFRSTYTFQSRELELKAATLGQNGAAFAFLDASGKLTKAQMQFGALASLRNSVETLAVRDMLQLLCQHFAENPLQQIFGEDQQLVVRIAAQTASGTGRVDYRMLAWLLGGRKLENVDAEEPCPRMVDEVLPTNAFQTEGTTGGYIDVQRRRFSGSLAEILPAEMGLWRERRLMLQKLLNEGVLTYVRENFEFIERELRVLFCFVVDNDPRMSYVRGEAHQGLTPYVRARALTALLLEDLARYLPRTDVKVECGVYLWSPADRRARKVEPTCRAEVDLQAWTTAEASDRFRFLQGLTAQFPEIFYSRVTEDDADARRHLEPDPVDFITHRHQSRRFHCRHVVYLTSSGSADRLLGDVDLRLHADSHGSDSLFVLTCDQGDATVGVSRARTPDGAVDEIRRGMEGRLSEERFRSQFLETVLLKGAGKPAALDDSGWGEPAA